jgi:hypothetical protein
MTTDRLPLGRMLAIFLGLLILANVILGAVGFFFPDLPIPSSMGIVVAMIAAMSSGQAASKALNRKLVFREKAVFALLATGISVLFGVAVIWAVLTYIGAPFTLENAILVMTGDTVPVDEILQILTWVVPIVLVLYVLITYFGAAMGSRNQIKLQERLAAKGK